MKREAELGIILKEILLGYSVINIKDIQAFVKHLDIFILADVDKVYLDFYERAIAEGIPTENQRLYFLNKENLWTEKNENELKTFKLYLNGLNKSKSKQTTVNQRKLVQKEINEAEIKFNRQNIERKELLGITAESIANKYRNNHLLKICLYKDINLNIRLIQNEDDLIDEYYPYFFRCLEKFDDKTIKSVAVTNQFLNLFSLESESPFNFFGKPVKDLTLYQSRLFYNGKIYLKIMQDPSFDSVPLDVKEDPDRLIEWYETKEAAKSVNKDVDTSTATHTEEHVKMYANEAAKKGGSLSMWDIIKMQGEG